MLDLPGAGLCVPDLAFVRARDGARVHFELLGFWSRDAVWRRVELVRAGLPHRILFAVSKGLRVGEAVLDETPTAALYVFARVIAAKQVLDRIERLAAAPTGSGPLTLTLSPLRGARANGCSVPIASSRTALR